MEPIRIFFIGMAVLIIIGMIIKLNHTRKKYMPKCKLCEKKLDMKKEETYINVTGGHFMPLCIDCWVNGVDREFTAEYFSFNKNKKGEFI